MASRKDQVSGISDTVSQLTLSENPARVIAAPSNETESHSRDGDEDAFELPGLGASMTLQSIGLNSMILNQALAGKDVDAIAGDLHAQVHALTLQLFELLKNKYPQRLHRVFDELTRRIDTECGDPRSDHLTKEWTAVMKAHPNLKRKLNSDIGMSEEAKNENAMYVFENSADLDILRPLNLEKYKEVFRPVDRRIVYDKLAEIERVANQALCIQSKFIQQIAMQMSALDDDENELNMTKIFSSMFNILANDEKLVSSMQEELLENGVLAQEEPAEIPEEIQKTNKLLAMRGFRR